MQDSIFLIALIVCILVGVGINWLTKDDSMQPLNGPMLFIAFLLFLLYLWAG